MCAYVPRVQVPVDVSPVGRLELELQEFVSCSRWVLGSKLGSSEKQSALNP